MPTLDYLSVGDVARRLGVSPRRITDLYYSGRVRSDRCPVIAGRRLIPPDMVEVIAMALRRLGVRVRDCAADGRRVRR